MTINKDPITCPSCGTVNPWVNDECRSCGTSLSHEHLREAAAEHSLDESINADSLGGEASTTAPNNPQGEKEAFGGSKTRPRRRWNIMWIVIGLFLYLAAMGVGEALILKWVVAPNSELRSVIEESTTVKDPESLSYEAKERMRSLLFSNTTFIASSLFLILMAPLLIGAIIGFFSGSILEGAAAMGIAAVLVFLNASHPAWALVAGPLNAGLGAAGAFGGLLLQHRIKQRQ
ncbi:MAG: hypothetical protein GY847_31055 [Proteobacteria bacterium]|nr:hypothetical protein [Pseudomonadota bacterium]